MDDDVKDVNASQEQTVDAPSQESEEEIVAEDFEEVFIDGDDETGEKDEESAEPQTQTRDENAKFAEIRRNAEQAGRDKLIAEQFGDLGIKTEAQYKQWMLEQQEEEEVKALVEQAQADGKDPDIVLALREKEKENQKLKEELQNTAYVNQVRTEWDSLMNDPIRKPYFLQWNKEIVDLIDNHGATPNAAFLALMNANLPSILQSGVEKGEQEAIKKINQNKQSSVSSATSTGNPLMEKPIMEYSDAEFQALRKQILSGEKTFT